MKSPKTFQIFLACFAMFFASACGTGRGAKYKEGQPLFQVRTDIPASEAIVYLFAKGSYQVTHFVPRPVWVGDHKVMTQRGRIYAVKVKPGSIPIKKMSWAKPRKEFDLDVEGGKAYFIKVTFRTMVLPGQQNFILLEMDEKDARAQMVGLKLDPKYSGG